MTKKQKITNLDEISKTIEAIRDYLMTIKSVGIKTTNRIVYKGKLKTLEIIQVDIDLLGKIKGVGLKRKYAIRKAVCHL